MPEPSPNRSVMIVLAYLWVLALVPLLLDKDPDVQWHARHGLVLALAELILLFVYVSVTSLVSMATLGLGCVLGLVLPFAWIAILGLHVVAIVKGLNGTRLMIPVISGYANRF